MIPFPQSTLVISLDWSKHKKIKALPVSSFRTYESLFLPGEAEAVMSRIAIFSLNVLKLLNQINIAV